MTLTAQTGWWSIPVALVGGLTLLWVALVPTMWLMKPDGVRLADAVRLLPDIVPPPPISRCRSTSSLTSCPWSDTPTTRSSSRWSCGMWHAEPEQRRWNGTGQAHRTAWLRCVGCAGYPDIRRVE